MARDVTVRISAVDNATNVFKRISNAMQRLSGKQRTFGDTVKGVVAGMGIYKAAGAAFSAVTNNMGNAVRRMDTMNNFPRVMQQMGYSAQDSKNSIDKLAKGVQGLPTALNDVVSITQRIASFNGDIGKATDTTLALNNAMLASGASSADASRGMEQYIQMMSAGKVDMQSWRTLQETMPYALQEVAKSFGLTGESAQRDLYDKLQKGEITFDQFNSKLIELSNAQGGFAEMAKNATAGIGTAFTNLQNAVVRGTTKMIESFSKFLEKVTGTNLQGHIENIGKGFESVLTKISSVIEGSANKITPYFDAVKQAFAGVGTDVKNAVMAVVTNLGFMNSSFTSVQSISNFRDFVQQVADKIRQFAQYVQQNGAVIAQHIAQLAKLAMAFKGLQFASGVFAPIIGLVANAGSAITKFTSTVLKLGQVPLGRHTTQMGFSFKALASSIGGSMASVGSFLLAIAGPVAIVVGVIAAMVAAWQSNFMNIQGFVKTAFGNIVKSFGTLKPAFSSVKPLVSVLGTVFKVLGTILIGTVVVAFAVLADSIRSTISLVTAGANAIQGIGQGIKGFWQKITGDAKGAKKSFDDAGKSFQQTGKSFGDAFDPKALKGTISATSELGKETEKTSSSSAKLAENFKTVTTSVTSDMQTMSIQASETSQAIQSAFTNQESGNISEHYQTMVQVFETNMKNMEDIANKHTERMTEAQNLEGEQRIQAVNRAFTQLLQYTNANHQTLKQSYDAVHAELQAGVNENGETLTNEQRKAMEIQLQATQEGLLKQNELILTAAQDKMAIGQALNQEELQQTQTALNENYQLRATSISENEQKLNELKTQIQSEQDEQKKIAMQQEIDTLNVHNEQLEQQQVAFGEQWLQLQANQGNMKAEQLAQQVANEKLTTQNGLNEILLAYQQQNNDIAGTLTILGGTMDAKAQEAIAKFQTAMKSGNKEDIRQALTTPVIDAMQKLPPEMFKGGETGRQRYIDSMKQGNVREAGRYLVEGAAQGAAQGKEKVGKEGGNAAKEYVKKVEAEKGNAKRSGEELGTSVENGAKTKKEAVGNIGKDSGSNYAKGVESKQGEARRAGTSLANAAKDGARSVSGFEGIGSNMAQGIASGINASAGAAISAMASLVARVNAEAKKKAEIKSPSRLFKREIGQNIALGVSEGISEETKSALSRMQQLIQAVQMNIQRGLSRSQTFSAGVDVTHEFSSSAFMQSLLDQIERLTNQQQIIQLDTGAFVGETVNQYDASLGSNVRNRGRYDW